MVPFPANSNTQEVASSANYLLRAWCPTVRVGNCSTLTRVSCRLSIVTERGQCGRISRLLTFDNSFLGVSYHRQSPIQEQTNQPTLAVWRILPTIPCAFAPTRTYANGNSKDTASSLRCCLGYSIANARASGTGQGALARPFAGPILKRYTECTLRTVLVPVKEPSSGQCPVMEHQPVDGNGPRVARNPLEGRGGAMVDSQ